MMWYADGESTTKNKKRNANDRQRPIHLPMRRSFAKWQLSLTHKKRSQWTMTLTTLWSKWIRTIAKKNDEILQTQHHN